MKLFWVMRALIYKMIYGNIGFFSYIGKPTYLYKYKNAKLGKKIRIYPGMRMEVYKKNSLEIRDDVSIGQNFHIIASNNLLIDSSVTISANVFISDTEHDYREIDKHIMNQKLITKKTKIGKNCFIGYGVIIQAGTELGKQCIVGSNSVVKGAFPDYCVIAGIPAKIIKRYNKEKEEWE